MKKRFLALSFGLLLTSISYSFAQEAPLKHTILTGETLSKLASKYETTVGDIMRFNGMNTDSKLVVGQEIKIPPAGVHIVSSESNSNTETAAKSANKTAESDPNSGKTHIVVAGESLYKVSRSYHVSVENLKKYNNLTDNNIKVGQVLRLSAEKGLTTVNSNTVPSENKEKAVTTTTPTSQPQDEKVEKVNSSATPKTDTNNSGNNSGESSETTQLAVTGGGAFGEMFGKDIEGRTLDQQKGLSKIFKSKSGWTDQKFYIMMNNVGPGSIVKVTYNGNSIFAKVLWNLIDTKENTGLKFRLSDAAAQALNITSDSFNLTVDFFE